MATIRDKQSATPSAVIDRPGSTARLVLLLAWPVLVQQILVLAVDLSCIAMASNRQLGFARGSLSQTG